jgi:ribokinase
MTKRPRIVVIGSLVFDFVASAARLPHPGETVLGNRFGMFPGGKGANQAVQAGRLGAEVFMVGCVGDDLLADRLLASLKDSNVQTDFVRRDPAVKTAACCIHVDAQGNNAIVIVPEANLACSRQDVDAAAEVILAADAVLCQFEIAMPTVQYAAELAAQCEVRFILNPAPAPVDPVAQELLAKTTILTPNESEARLLCGMLHAEQDQGESRLARDLLARGPQTIILTLGERGAYFVTKEQEQRVPAFRVPVVDTTAAGDAFNGALAVALAEGKDLQEAVRFANAAGALATTRAGAQPSLAWRAEVDKLMGSGEIA